MADVVDRATRSRMMSGIRGKDTKPEIAVRSFLHRHGFRYRIHVKRLPGRPDLVLPKYSAVVNVHGCFWHQHANCPYAYMPASNREFWKEKLGGNVIRDLKNEQKLREQGWRVFTIWECEVSDAKRLNDLARVIRS